MNPLEAHPAADLFPMMGGADYAALKDDIEKNGLREPITLCEGKILDGRNRFRACEELGVQPKLAQYEGASPTAFVWSMNGARRHLKKGQLAMIAQKMLPHLQEEAKKRQGARTDILPISAESSSSEADQTSNEVAAAIVGVGKGMVQQANYVAKNAPELVTKVETGEVTLNSAYESVKRGRAIPSKPRNLPRAERIEQIRSLAADGNCSGQIAEKIGITDQQVRVIAREAKITLPDAAIGKVHRINIHRVIESTVHGLEGYAQGLQVVNGGVIGIDRNDAAAWADSLRVSLGTINKLRKQLTRHANGN